MDIRPPKEKRKKRPMALSRKIFNILLSMLGLLIALFVVRYVNVMFFNPMSAFDTPKPLVTATPAPLPPQVLNAGVTTPNTPAPTLSPEEALRQQADAEFMKNRVNILMLGWDQSPEREDESNDVYRDKDNNFRSDVIMLLTVNFETGRVDLISIPRDTYAPIYNTKGHWKINAAFAKGGSVEGEGFLYAMHTVGDLLGIPIQYYAGVDMTGLKAVVDAMGGVEYDVDVRISLNGRVLEKGYQHLNGQQVLDYCRARKGISTDVGRADRQQRMLFAIFSQMKNANQLVNIPKIYASVQDMVHTNMNSEQIAALAAFSMKLDMENLHRHTLKGQYVTNVYNASFYVLNNTSLKSLIKEVFAADIQPKNQYDVDYVQADKAASAAMPYLSGAEHLIEIFGAEAPGVELLAECAVDLKSAADRSVATSGKTDDSPLDKAAIESAQHKLHSAMLNVCRQNNVTKEQVDRDKMPGEVYSELPSSTIPIQLPAQMRNEKTPAPSSTPAPTSDTEPIH